MLIQYSPSYRVELISIRHGNETSGKASRIPISLAKLPVAIRSPLASRFGVCFAPELPRENTGLTAPLTIGRNRPRPMRSDQDLLARGALP